MSKKNAVRLFLTVMMLALTIEMTLRGNAWGAAICGIATGGYLMMLCRD